MTSIKSKRRAHALRFCIAHTALGVAAAAALSLTVVSMNAQAQAVVMAGSYSNYDVLNTNGTPACGFEMEVWGVSKSQLTRIFPGPTWETAIRYGTGTATDFPGGTYVRWMSSYDAATGAYTSCTPVPKSLTSVPGESCWTGGMGTAYPAAGCEHFGISSNSSPSKILYRWLLPDPANPGQLIRANTDVSIPAPLWTASPPAAPGLPPVVLAEIAAAPPAPAPIPQFGEAQWVKVFKNERPGKVELIELVGDNAVVVPHDAAHLETNWALLQADPLGSGQRRRGKVANQANLGNGNHAVVRRYEYYKYAGTYDPVTHQALCADVVCLSPAAAELGDAIGAQNVAVNLDVNALTVNVAGNGSVSSTDKTFGCPSKCYGVYAPAATVTLTAKASSGNTFATWSGACGGNASTCTVTMNAETTVGATFTAVVGGGGGGGGGVGAATSFTLGVSLANAGTVTSAPGGINCGASCSASYPAGTAVTLTATPPVGKTFASWSGACAGAAPSCTVTLSSNLSVKANFNK